MGRQQVATAMGAGLLVAALGAGLVLGGPAAPVSASTTPTTNAYCPMPSDPFCLLMPGTTKTASSGTTTDLYDQSWTLIGRVTVAWSQTLPVAALSVHYEPLSSQRAGLNVAPKAAGDQSQLATMILPGAGSLAISIQRNRILMTAVLTTATGTWTVISPETNTWLLSAA